MWRHSLRCPKTVALYYAHGHTAESWTHRDFQCCPYRCAGQVMGYCVTHAHDCPFWDDGSVGDAWEPESPRNKETGI